MATELGPKIVMGNADVPANNATGMQPVYRSDDIVVDYKTPQRTYKDILAARAQKTDQVSNNSVPAPAEPKVAATSPAESVTLSPAAAALARKEQAFRREQQALKLKEAEIANERAEIAELKALKAKLANKDYSDLEKYASYEEYTNYLIDKSATTDPAQEEIKALKTEIDEVKKKQQDDVDKRYDAVVAERRTAVKELVDTDPQYSSIKELNMQEAVVQHIVDTWDNDQEVLSPEQAAKEVEEILLEKATQELAKLSALSKLKPKETEAQKNQLPPLKPKVNTITNQMAPTGEIKITKRSFEGMSDRDRYAEAKRRVQEKQIKG